MNFASAVQYKGWTMTAMCLKHTDPVVAGPDTYTGRVISILNDPREAARWTDSGPQISNIIGRVFMSTEGCLRALLAEASALIDALQVPGPAAGLRSALRSHAVTRARDAMHACPVAIPDVVLSRHALLNCIRRPVSQHLRMAPGQH